MANTNRIIHADDCLNVLNDEVALPSDSVDLIYLDPPFNSKSTYNLPFKGQYKYAKPVEAFTDTWTWGAQEDDYLSDLSQGPSTTRLAEIVTLAKKNLKSQPHRFKSPSIFNQHDHSAYPDEESIKGQWIPLPTLRPDC